MNAVSFTLLRKEEQVEKCGARKILDDHEILENDKENSNTL